MQRPLSESIAQFGAEQMCATLRHQLTKFQQQLVLFQSRRRRHRHRRRRRRSSVYSAHTKPATLEENRMQETVLTNEERNPAVVASLIITRSLVCSIYASLDFHLIEQTHRGFCLALPVVRLLFRDSGA